MRRAVDEDKTNTVRLSATPMIEPKRNEVWGSEVPLRRGGTVLIRLKSEV